MNMPRRDLPRRVYAKHGAYYFVAPDTGWHRLCAIKEGLPAMYRALATLTDRESTSDRMPAVIARWLDDRKQLAGWADSTERMQEHYAQVMGKAFTEFAPSQVDPPACAKYLRRFAATPRTHNAHRTMLRQVLAFSALEGLRDGHNPVDNIQPRKTEVRKRWVLDTEIAALRKAAMQQSRNGEALVQMIDLALLTGQRIGDLINLRWQDVTTEGLVVVQGKTKERLLIEWTPALKAAIDACERGDRIGHVLRTQSGHGYRYAGIRSAWDRACVRAGIDDLHIHDLRGRAGMDKRDADGLEAAKELLGHKTMRQTSDYVDGKAPRKVRPSK